MHSYFKSNMLQYHSKCLSISSVCLFLDLSKNKEARKTIDEKNMINKQQCELSYIVNAETRDFVVRGCLI